MYFYHCALDSCVLFNAASHMGSCWWVVRVWDTRAPTSVLCKLSASPSPLMVMWALFIAVHWIFAVMQLALLIEQLAWMKDRKKKGCFFAFCFFFRQYILWKGVKGSDSVKGFTLNTTHQSYNWQLELAEASASSHLTLRVWVINLSQYARSYVTEPGN